MLLVVKALHQLDTTCMYSDMQFIVKAKHTTMIKLDLVGARSKPVSNQYYIVITPDVLVTNLIKSK